ncbi:MAG TPA: winged helix-turn-helix domain-containing protein [Acidobacteriaceae bacterium]|nr:winged helix-turn-helix domain-containing protein [Acidobacteriaceae bacterium]
MPTTTAARYQFGPFEVNAGSGELLREGRPIKLQEQPFRLLVILLENAGSVVSREQIQQRIWGERTFGDFDSGLRVAMRKLREALGDDADSPVYIETLPKRGYRMLVPVVAVAAAQPLATPSETGASRLRNWAIMAAAVAVAAILLVVFRPLLRPRRATALTAKDSVVLADFSNATGDPVFDATLRQGLEVQLEQSPFLSIVPDERVEQTLANMEAAADSRLTPEVARQVCLRTGSAAVLEGSIANLGSRYVVGLRAKNCHTGAVLDEEQAEAAKKEEVLDALTKIAGKFRARVGESLASIEQHDTPLAEATTSSLDALRAYSLGWRNLHASGDAEALPFFQRAVALDPKFAMAWGFLGRVYGDLGEAALSAQSTAQAYALRDRTSDREKFWITTSYDTQVTENMPRAQQSCQVWIQTYPRDPLPYTFLSGIVDPVLGRYEQALDEARKARDLDPDFAIAHLLVAAYLQALGRYQEAENALHEAENRKIEMPEFLQQRYDLAFVQGNAAEMERVVELSRGKPSAEEWVTFHRGFVLAYSGRLREAEKVSQQAQDLARRSGHGESAALYAAGEALWEGFFGNPDEARRAASGALRMSNDRGVEYGAGLALALAGDSARARQIAADLERRFPEDTSVQFSYLPVLRAQLSLNEGEPAKAVEALSKAQPYELGMPRTAIHANFGALYPVYLRGLAYLALHRGAEAEPEFRRILDRPGIVVSDPVGALAHLQLARAEARAGFAKSARSEYQEFFSLWINADPNLPILREARTEDGELNRKSGDSPNAR